MRIIPIAIIPSPFRILNGLVFEARSLEFRIVDKAVRVQRFCVVDLNVERDVHLLSTGWLSLGIEVATQMRIDAFMD